MAAGRAGAAARKAKHEKLLAQLREVKDNIREPVIDGVSKATDAGRVPAAQASSASLQVVDTTGHLESAGAAKTGTMTDWTPWVAGGIGEEVMICNGIISRALRRSVHLRCLAGHP